MKLRNKKTGEIITLKDEGELALLKLIENSLPNGLSLWEEVKEPLIKDEKIRKAVRAWAEATNTERIYLSVENEEGSTFCVYTFQSDCNFIQIATHDHDPIEGGRTYAITELCGEEEE